MIRLQKSLQTLHYLSNIGKYSSNPLKENSDIELDGVIPYDFYFNDKTVHVIMKHNIPANERLIAAISVLAKLILDNKFDESLVDLLCDFEDINSLSEEEQLNLLIVLNKNK
jgi:hypothetical protein